MKLRHSFQDSHSNEVTGVQFNKSKPHIAISCGEDYLINMFDLTSEKEDDYIDSSFSAM
jgi:WD40 repeat protein